MPKYYVCEGDANEGVTKVTPTDSAEEAVNIAQESTASVHFVSTVNPCESDDKNAEGKQ
jgi:hypothetical protein